MDYEERFGATLNAELDLSRFPFDQQALDMELQSFVWDRSEISLVRNQAQTGFDDEFETPEWSVTAVEGLIGAGMEVRDDREFSNYTFRIHAERQSGHYLLRLFLPLLFVMAATWLAFWEPAADRPLFAMVPAFDHSDRAFHSRFDTLELNSRCSVG